jgi:hypothetical protein
MLKISCKHGLFRPWHGEKGRISHHHRPLPAAAYFDEQD